jgi:methylated-DNA-protein-cysteine methyltransferase-like protein
MNMDSFFEQVYSIVEQIPYGKVVSYGQIAWMIGYPKLARRVGRVMRYCPQHLPCHRVVMADGAVSGGDADTRKALLTTEGATFLPDGRVDMKECRWLKGLE